MDNLQVFISWSGPRAEAIAKLVKRLLVDVVRHAEVFLSSDDLQKGRQWLPDLNEKLRDTKFGVLILTPESVNKPWLLFEAGAISKALTDNHCCPLLCGLSHADVTPPLSQFHGALINKREDVLKLITTMYEAAGAKSDPGQVDRWFTPFWENFSNDVAQILVTPTTEHKAKPPHRPDREILEEILDLVRRQGQGIRASARPSEEMAEFQKANALAAIRAVEAIENSRRIVDMVDKSVLLANAQKDALSRLNLPTIPPSMRDGIEASVARLRPPRAE